LRGGRNRCVSGKKVGFEWVILDRMIREYGEVLTKDEAGYNILFEKLRKQKKNFLVYHMGLLCAQVEMKQYFLCLILERMIMNLIDKKGWRLYSRG